MDECSRPLSFRANSKRCAREEVCVRGVHTKLKEKVNGKSRVSLGATPTLLPQVGGIPLQGQYWPFFNLTYALSDKIAPKLRQIAETAGAAKPHGIGSPHQAASWRRGNFDGRKPAKFAAKISKIILRIQNPPAQVLHSSPPDTKYPKKGSWQSGQ
ncbi:hypothetical protein Bbelb_063660, partial [Branchiostoma belcheri]